MFKVEVTQSVIFSNHLVFSTYQYQKANKAFLRRRVSSVVEHQRSPVQF